MIRIPLALSLALLPALARAEPVSPATAPAGDKQLVIVSFDGAHDNALWEKSLAMAKRTGAHFTYFLSCTFLMTRADGKTLYKPPGQKAGRSNVGFAQSREEIAARAGHIWQAHLDGHDIASHACGHFDGKGWSKADWESEFSTFDTALKDAWKKAGTPDAEPQGWADFAKAGVKGFRAPYLSLSDGLAPALKEWGFTYDASLVTKGPGWPTTKDGLPRFGLPLIPEGPSQRPVIGMDYNLFVRHSMGVENKKDSARFEERTYEAYKKAFDREYTGDRIPLQLGFHFVEMNGGAYWRALDRLLSEVCGKADVACVSYAQALPLIEQAKKKAGRTAF
ncbi:polysaccharide deacetylase [Ensifer sp. ENS09]|uniref:polysaccharide deacetylase family protein n=1 Tax=Ensifer sp. ENS09 TaxID=2769263 RepID=UPI00177E3A5E|nr:polysaccharide deacetylase [Ensifer sp. ENS09]MBD9648099.1 polysaccharide deacetylase [Ensifer sp. ENS09]